MKPTAGAKAPQSYIALKFSVGGAISKKDEADDRLVGLISAEDRTLLSLAEKN